MTTTVVRQAMSTIETIKAGGRQTRASLLPLTRRGAVTAAALGANVVVGTALAAGQTKLVILIALAPLFVVVSALIVTRRDWIVLAALLLTMLGGRLTERLPGTGGTAIYPSDVFLALAIAGYAIERLTSPRALTRERRPAFILTWPLALFALTLMIGVFRGHERYGTSYLSQPTRMFLDAAIIVAISSMKSPAAYRDVVRVFYAMTVVQALIGAYHMAAGTSQTASSALSTGGTRALALTTAMFLAGALVLALLNLEIDPRGRRMVHFAIAGLAVFGIVISLGRTTFAAVAVVVPVLLIGLRRLRRTMLAYAPLILVVLIAVVVVALQLVPSLGTTLGDRLTGHVTNDPSLVQRERKFKATLQGFGAEPLLGLGFGRPVTFTAIDGTVVTFSGDPEDSYIYVLAGGGIFALAALIVLILAFFGDAVYRLRHARGEDRALIVLSMSLVFIFLVNASTYPTLSDPNLMLVLWIAMLLPTVVHGERSMSRAGRPERRPPIAAVG
ncbi:MAG: O-antigen ligase family protein [Gaiellaceae bacterium]